MYKCRECAELFEEPDYIEICYEDYYGVGSMFPDKHYGVFCECPYCGHPIDIHEDCYDEDEEDDDEWEEDEE